MNQSVGNFDQFLIEIPSNSSNDDLRPANDPSVRDVLNSYFDEFDIGCTFCKVVEPTVHLKIDVEDSESFIIDDKKLAGSMYDTAVKFSRNYPGRNKMFFILNIFIEGCYS